MAKDGDHRPLTTPASCQTKRTYHSMSDAWRSTCARFKNKKLRAYRCNICDMFHVTHESKEGIQKRRPRLRRR